MIQNPAVETIERQSPAMVAVSASAWSNDTDLLMRHDKPIAKACRRSGAVLVLGGAGNWPQKQAYGHRVQSFAEFAHFCAKTRAHNKPIA